MLDDYKEEQPIIYKILYNSVKKNKLSHAYLFELNGFSKGLDMALAFAKFLLCPYNYCNSNLCNNCNQCKKIETNNFLEVKIIDTDGQWIKKEQLEELQRAFMTKSLIGSKKVYIIKNAEKLNVASSNSILKFLEEPPEGIVAILLTDNMYNLLNTIISRCQILSFKKVSKNVDSIHKFSQYLYSDSKDCSEFLENTGIAYINTIVEYVSFLEKNKCETMIYKNKEFIAQFNDRKKLKVAFDLFILYYKDALNKILNISCEYFNEYMDSISLIIERNTIESLSKKIKILIDLQQCIKYNLNANLLLDKLVIKFSEV